MKLLTLVILMIVFKNSYSLSCLTSDDGDPLSFNTLTSDADNIMEEVELLRTIDPDDDDVCRVELYIDYDTQNLEIQFTEHLQDSDLEDQQVEIDIQVKDNQINNIHIEHYLEHVCSHDACDLDFITKYIEWFINAGRPELHDRLAPWILGNNQESGNCLYPDGMAKECSSEHCVADFDMNINGELVLYPFCADDDNIEKAGLYFILIFDLNFDYIAWGHQFRCNYNNCNNKTIVGNVMKIFHEEYKILSITEEFGFDNKNEEVTTTTFVNPSDSQQQTDLVTSTSTVSSSKSTTITSLVTNPYINNTLTTIVDTTTELNNGLRCQNTNAIIYVALFILRSHWLFLA